MRRLLEEPVPDANVACHIRSAARLHAYPMTMQQWSVLVLAWYHESKRIGNEEFHAQMAISGQLLGLHVSPSRNCPRSFVYCPLPLALTYLRPRSLFFFPRSPSPPQSFVILSFVVVDTIFVVALCPVGLEEQERRTRFPTHSFATHFWSIEPYRRLNVSPDFKKI